jgi:hypothetical protein
VDGFFWQIQALPAIFEDFFRSAMARGDARLWE